jgi:hypothetical protein
MYVCIYIYHYSASYLYIRCQVITRACYCGNDACVHYTHYVSDRLTHTTHKHTHHSTLLAHTLFSPAHHVSKARRSSVHQRRPPAATLSPINVRSALMHAVIYNLVGERMCLV